MLLNKEIREEVIKDFTEYHYVVEHINIGNSYYLFDLGEESVVHFKINGCKRWLFGLWITGDDNETRIYLFGEHEDYIDKFKPTQTVLSENIKVSNDISDEDLKNEIEGLVWSLIYNQVNIIYSSNLGGKIKFYYPGNENLIKWLFGQWWFYRIEYPFRKWLKYTGNKYVCMVICFILNLIYGRRLSATCKETTYYSPTYIVYLNYKEGVDDDGIYKVYYHINGNVGFDKSIRIEHIPFGEKRGIYFEKEEE